MVKNDSRAKAPRQGAAVKGGGNNGTAAKRRERRLRRLGGQAMGGMGADARSYAPVAQSLVVEGDNSAVWTMERGDGSVCIRHSEFVADLPGAVNFTAASTGINPGLAAVFPWLSNIALSYETYRFKKLKFRYETEKGTSLNGTNLMAVDFDAGDSAPISKQELMANKCRARGAIWQRDEMSVHDADMSALTDHRFIRGGALAANQDVKTYDVGSLITAAQGCADTSAIGELYVDYEVCLYTPQPGNLAIVASNTALVAGAGSVSKTAYFGSSATITGNLPCTASGNTFTFNKVGKWTFVSTVGGTVITATSPTQTGTVASAVDAIGSVLLNAGASLGITQWNITVSAIGQTFILDWSGTTTTVTSSTTRVTGYVTAL